MALVSHAHTVWEGTLFGAAETSSTRPTCPSRRSPGRPVPRSTAAYQPRGADRAAHSSCFSMALSNALAKAGTLAKSLHTSLGHLPAG